MKTAVILASLLLLLAGCASAAKPVECPSPRRDTVVATLDLHDLFEPAGGGDPLLPGTEAADRWAHRILDRSCWSEGIPETTWMGRGVLTVVGAPEAVERLAAEVALVRAARRRREPAGPK